MVILTEISWEHDAEKKKHAGRKSGKKQKDFWIEKYDSRWKADNDDSEFEILIPVI